MKKIVALALPLILSLPVAHAAEEAEEAGRILSVNGEPVSEMLFGAYQSERQANGRMPGGNTQDQQVAMLNELVNAMILAQDAEKKGLAKDESLQAIMQVARIKWLTRAAIAKQVNDNPVSDEQLKAAYEERFTGDDKKEFKASHILLKTREEAEAVIDELDGGKDFAELAKAKSTGPSASRGGDLGWFTTDQMVPAFSSAAAALDKGKYSSEPVETQFGWHVIQLNDERAVTPPTFESVKDQLRTQLQQEMLQDYISELRKESKIDVVESKVQIKKP